MHRRIWCMRVVRHCFGQTKLQLDRCHFFELLIEDWFWAWVHWCNSDEYFENSTIFNSWKLSWRPNSRGMMVLFYVTTVRGSSSLAFFYSSFLKKTERLLAERLNSHNKISFAIFSTSDVNTPLDGSTYHRWKLHCYGEILKMLLNNTFGLLSDHCSHLQTNGAGSSVGGCNCPGGCVFQNPKWSFVMHYNIFFIRVTTAILLYVCIWLSQIKTH